MASTRVGSTYELSEADNEVETIHWNSPVGNGMQFAGDAGHDYPLILTADLQPVVKKSSPKNKIKLNFTDWTSEQKKMLAVYGSIVVCLVVLMFSAVEWFSLFHGALNTIPRTFAWEQIIYILGSNYDNCINYSNFSSPIETASEGECSYNWSVPWIPMVGWMICIFALLAAFCVVMEMIYCGRLCIVWIIMLVKLSFAELIHFTLALVRMESTTSFSENGDGVKNWSEHLRRHMLFTMKDGEQDNFSPEDIYFRWNITQTLSKCCGLDGMGDWKFQIFRTGDPRFPMSCCNTTDDYKCPQFPTRYQVWQRACFSAERETVQSYRHWQMLLLVLTLLSLIQLTINAIQMCSFLEKESFTSFFVKWSHPKDIIWSAKSKIKNCMLTERPKSKP